MGLGRAGLEIGEPVANTGNKQRKVRKNAMLPKQALLEVFGTFLDQVNIAFSSPGHQRPAFSYYENFFRKFQSSRDPRQLERKKGYQTCHWCQIRRVSHWTCSVHTTRYHQRRRRSGEPRDRSLRTGSVPGLGFPPKARTRGIA